MPPDAPEPPWPHRVDAPQLSFMPQPMVSWLSPRILVEAALRVGVSSLFGEYADKREFQAALDPEPGRPVAYGEVDKSDGALWLDFVADLADGFDSTYAVACLLGRPRLGVRDGGRDYDLPRGRALVMGGDEVYSVPTRADYENRLRGPYAAALPGPVSPQPDLLAIPGNHDWYDGLTNFLRVFCAERDIGAWKTRQRRSYFALRLPHRWWLLGIDIQLDTYIDDSQLAYFKGVGLRRGDRVILVTGKPSWVKVRPGHEPASHRNLRYFKEHVVKPAGAEVAVTLTGDLHHYARYAIEGEDQLITAGGGGAYLYPTHQLNSELRLPGHRTPHRLVECFPSAEESEQLTWGALGLPKLARGLCVILAVLYALLDASLFAAIASGPGWWVAVVAVALVIVGTLLGYAGARSSLARLVVGAQHALAHLVLAALPALITTLAFGADGAVGGLLAAAVSAAVGFSLGGVTFGLYLVLSHPFVPRHVNEVLACQGIPDYKNFLRLRLDQGGLTIYPIGIRKVPRRWGRVAERGPEDPVLAPAEGELVAELIEPPIEVPVSRRREHIPDLDGGRR